MTDDRVLKGIGLRLIAIFFLSTMSALIKLASRAGRRCPRPCSFASFARCRSCWPSCGGAGALVAAHHAVKGHAKRAMVGLVGMVFTFGAVMLLPLAEATTFQFTVPIFATLLGALVLREKTGCSGGARC